jgi:hypothetical protein
MNLIGNKKRKRLKEGGVGSCGEREIEVPYRGFMPFSLGALPCVELTGCYHTRPVISDEVY